MSIEALMNQPVTLRSLSGYTRDTIGGAEPTYTETSTTMYLEPRAGREQMQDRNTPIGDWLGVGRASIAWDSTNQIVYGLHVFDVVAPPRTFYDPVTGIDSHVELDLQEVT